MVISQYEVYLISLDPTIGHEIKKVRPCVIISPDEMNKNISTVIIAPMTTPDFDTCKLILDIYPLEPL